MNDPHQIAAEAAELLRIRKLLRDNINNSEFAEVITEFKSAIEKAKEQSERDLLELAWGIIANAGGGDWQKESTEWQDAAIRWRDKYFGSLKQVSKASSEMPNTHEPPRAAHCDMSDPDDECDCHDKSASSCRIHGPIFRAAHESEGQI